MNELTLDELLRILTTAAGLGDQLDPSQDLSHRSFEELGYDSLALLETAAQVEHEFGVLLPEDQVTELKTPRDLLDLVNEELASRP